MPSTWRVGIAIDACDSNTAVFLGDNVIFTDDKNGWILSDNGKLFYTKKL